MLIEKSKLPNNALANDIAIVTGAGRGIGLETARALLWLGAHVVLAEIDENNGREAAEKMGKEFGTDRVLFLRTDVGEEDSVASLALETRRAFGPASIVINNATIFPMGPVSEVPIDAWDRSYRVNLRGPVLMARTFLPEMIGSRHGTFVCVSSSGAAPFMGAYEVFKTSQVELSNTISAEIEGTGVYAYTIGPGIVKTPGFLDGGARVAAFMGMTIDGLVKMNQDAFLTAEEAGVGFAASAVMANKYHGKEISSIQVLKDVGIDPAGPMEGQALGNMDRGRAEKALDQVRSTFAQQSEGWRSRNLFERQWVARDFKKQTGMSIDEMADTLGRARAGLADGSSTGDIQGTMKSLRKYYEHQSELLKGFEKDKKKLDVGLKTIESWVTEIDELLRALGA
jgi:NAD(P)-dependent dehydrogenase (short-subunit alcohol dehydrogenase family)